MLVIPVMDVQKGVVVHGRAGHRDQYQPIHSQLCQGAEPHDVATAFRDFARCSDVYIADLDAVTGGEPAMELFRGLQALGLRLWVDAGVRDVARARSILDSGLVSRAIIGSETLFSPATLKALLHSHGSEAVVFSMDLKDGKPLTAAPEWRGRSAREILDEVMAMGVCHVILLDLARVGMDGGIGTESLLQHARGRTSAMNVYVGGGIRGIEDVVAMERQGAAGVLVASALHDGRLNPNMLADDT